MSGPRLICAALLFLTVGAPWLRADEKLELGWGTYAQGAPVAGNVSIAGSDTLNNVMGAWANAFRRFQPGVNIGVESRGSSTAPPALLERTIDIGVMSRPMNGGEIAEHRRRFGSNPVEIAVALDAVAIYVNKGNPLERITLRQLRSLFSEPRLSSSGFGLWSDLGLPEPFGRFAISRYGRNAASGTYSFFKDRVLIAEDFSRRIEEFPGSSALVRAVGADRHAVGYSGVGYETGNVRILSVSADGLQFFYPTYESCLTGDYPLAREILFYLPAPSDEGLVGPVAEFVRFVLSSQGQELLVETGFYPVSHSDSFEIIQQIAGEE